MDWNRWRNDYFPGRVTGSAEGVEEAAVIDGANFFQKLRSVILPLLTPVFFTSLISIIFSLQILIEPILLGGSTAGGLLTPRLLEQTICT